MMLLPLVLDPSAPTIERAVDHAEHAVSADAAIEGLEGGLDADAALGGNVPRLFCEALP
jgi:hypothetical protein